MMKIYNILLCVVLCAHSSISAQQTLNKEVLDRTFKKMLDFEIPIRVLLSESNTSDIKWAIGSAEGFVVYDPMTREKTLFKGKGLLVTFAQNQFYLNGKKMAGDHMFIMPLMGLIRKGHVSYDGVFSITRVNAKAYLVNHLDLEQYLQSVLPYESIPGWPDEVQKALCIAFRSYAISKVLEQRAQHEKNKIAHPYDIKSTNEHQIYRGHESRTCYKKIVEDTRGIVLAYNNKPALAMFDIACGGVIPALKKGLHFSKAPYLERKYPCNYCKDHKYYRWEATYTLSDIEKLLKKDFPNMGMLRDLVVESYDKAGVATSIRVKASHRWFSISASKFKSYFKELRSLAFDFKRTGRLLLIRGRGHGHHIGLCQWGALFLIKQGWNYKNVLRFYYPKATFMKLKRL